MQQRLIRESFVKQLFKIKHFVLFLLWADLFCDLFRLILLLSKVTLKIVAHYFHPGHFRTMLKSILLFTSLIRAEDFKQKAEEVKIVAIEFYKYGKSGLSELVFHHHVLSYLRQVLLNLANCQLSNNDSRTVIRVNP